MTTVYLASPVNRTMTSTSGTRHPALNPLELKLVVHACRQMLRKWEREAEKDQYSTDIRMKKLQDAARMRAVLRRLEENLT